MKKHGSRILMAALALASAMALRGAAPAGYYSSCENKGGKQLLSALCSTINNHTQVGYDGLWDLYPSSDADADGKLIDLYSTKRWSPSERCGNYSRVGDCYNREHSFPKSWFGGKVNPMYCDAFHLYPTDGYVNNQRSNYPYGECANGTSVASNGSIKPLGKLGTSTYPGYSGKVFEPADEYKGDLARSYFYMIACYNNQVDGWDSDMLAGNSYPAFTTWAAEMLMKWHRQDPVSDKELKRQEAVYNKQHNRNPFIDHPEMAEYIWGSKKAETWNSGTTAEPALAVPAAGATIDCGSVAAGSKKTTAVSVRGTDFTQPLSVSVAGDGFSCATSEISAARVNAGTSVDIVFADDEVGRHTGTLRLRSGAIDVSVTLKAEVLGGITALPASDIGSGAFTARWVDCSKGSGEQYTLHVSRDSATLPGYPLKVDASAEEQRVDGLEPETEYEYYLTDSRGTMSNVVTAITFGEAPEIYVYCDDELDLHATVGFCSDPITVFIETYALDGEIDVEVKYPFELGTDRHNWGSYATLDPETDHFYVRLNGERPGTFDCSVLVSCNGLLNDDIDLHGEVGYDSGLRPVAARGAWEAYELDGVLAIENGVGRPVVAAVYGMDGLTWFHGFVAEGITTVDLPAGLYIVVVGDDARHVVIR